MRPVDPAEALVPLFLVYPTPILVKATPGKADRMRFWRLFLQAVPVWSLEKWQ